MGNEHCEYVSPADVAEEAIDDSCREKEQARHIRLGKHGEEAACAFLTRQGFDILERNWTCPAGEVDIVARGYRSLHFVEVKTRRGTGRGFPEEAVDAEKRRRYERIAEYYLREYDEVDISICFDIIAILVTGPHRAYLRFHVNAFASG